MQLFIIRWEGRTMYNIYDVAERAGVSRSTVSRVLNHQESVSEEKRQRVLEVIKAMNYTPNATARALAMNKTNTLGIIARELTEVFNARFIDGIQKCADHNHYGALFCIRSKSSESNINYIDFLNKKVDGFIFIGQDTVSESELIHLSKSNIPVVAMEIKYPVEGVSFVTVNNEESISSGVDYLVGLGHKKIAYIAATDAMQENEERKAGYLKGISQQGLIYQNIVDCPYDYPESKTAVEEFLPRLLFDGVTAAICFNNEIAVAVIEGLIKRGVRIPKDFSVIGFDDIHYTNLAEISIPRITSFLQPQEEMAEYATVQLLKRIEHKTTANSSFKNKEFKCVLKIHETTGVAPNE